MGWPPSDGISINGGEMEQQEKKLFPLQNDLLRKEAVYLFPWNVSVWSAWVWTKLVLMSTAICTVGSQGKSQDWPGLFLGGSSPQLRGELRGRSLQRCSRSSPSSQTLEVSHVRGQGPAIVYSEWGPWSQRPLNLSAVQSTWGQARADSASLLQSSGSRRPARTGRGPPGTGRPPLPPPPGLRARRTPPSLARKAARPAPRSRRALHGGRQGQRRGRLPASASLGVCGPLASRPPRPGSRARIGPTLRPASPAVRREERASAAEPPAVPYRLTTPVLILICLTRGSAMVPKAPQEGEAGLRGAPAQKGRWSGRGAQSARMRTWRARPRLASRLLPGILASRLLVPRAGDSQSPIPAASPWCLDRICTQAALLFSQSP
jgi:hypothetical protein